MGIGVHEGPLACQFERKPSDYCASNALLYHIMNYKVQRLHSTPCCKRSAYLIIRISVQVAKEYSEQLGVDACIKLFEQFKSYEGLYFFLGSSLSSR